MPNDGTANLHPEVKGTRKLNLREKRAIAEYIKTGIKSAAYRSVYKTGRLKDGSSNAAQLANMFFKKPKIVNALEKALKESKFDDQYAVETLKKIVEGGMENIDIARPDTSLKALETYFKITNKIGGGGKDIKPDTEAMAKKMDINQLSAALREMDKKQKRILAIIQGRVQDVEVVE